jgi:hypothetical protein
MIHRFSSLRTLNCCQKRGVLRAEVFLVRIDVHRSNFLLSACVSVIINSQHQVYFSTEIRLTIRSTQSTIQI